MADVEGNGSTANRDLDPPAQKSFEASPAQDQSSGTSQGSAGAASGSSDGGSFDCNICLELAQDPVVTLCGHLFCWPCLYRWLRLHSSCHECPVCKALVEEEKVVPLYGRGKVGSVDPRTKTMPDESIPERPSGQRPDTARPPEGQFHQQGFNFMAGPGGPMATARFGNFTFSAGFGLFPALFGFQVHGLSNSSAFGPGYPFGGPVGWQSAYAQPGQPLTADQQQDATLSKLLLFLGILVILCIVFF